jgi:hypothetical protein
MLKKLKFILKLSFYPVSRFLGIKYNIEKVINNYYKDEFYKVPLKDRAVLLPHCLIHKKCPAKFSKEEGILCIKCSLCKCGEIKGLCDKKGYQFYITPSVGFTKRLIQRKRLKAVIGAACIYEVKKGLKKEKVNSKGLNIEKIKVKPLLLYMPKYDCIDNDLDFEKLKKML